MNRLPRALVSVLLSAGFSLPLIAVPESAGEDPLAAVSPCGDCRGDEVLSLSLEEAILLSDHIVVLTRRPGRVKAEVQVALPRPRRESDPGFIEMKQRIRDLIHDEFEVET